MMKKLLLFFLLPFHLPFFSSLLLLVPPLLVLQSPVNSYLLCLNNTVYDSNSKYMTNVNLLFASLTSNASLNKGYYNDTIGDNSDKVYGLGLCRGDATRNECQNCIKQAGEELKEQCRDESAIDWQDHCLLRYSNQRFFGSVDNSTKFPIPNPSNTSNPDLLRRTLTELLNSLSSEAAFKPWTSMYATGEANFTSSQPKIYGLVQCTRDISARDCKGCLENLISEIPKSTIDGKNGGRIFGSSCIIWYEDNKWYKASAILAPAPTTPAVSSSPPASTTTPSSNGTPARPFHTGRRLTSSRTILIIVCTVIAVAILSIIAIILLTKKTSLRRKKTPTSMRDLLDGRETSFLFKLDTIRAATDGFLDANKLGEGGFGPVYKGKLQDGQEIAVKRLSINSGQGAEQFKNEITLLAKLQHRNLVRLFGCCLEGVEKLLIYEYVPNKSLNNFLFDPTNHTSLDWPTRYKIIGGISRGLLYLHEESRLRIIHRDLKASNILLDNEMNPKISDFGLAKLFGVDQTQASTNTVAGTYGYMPPEYAIHGRCSIKTDVFGFGVLVIEILTGQKTTDFYQSDNGENLLSYAWKAWNNGTIFEIVDSILYGHYSRNEVMRCIYIGLLCVQEDATKRPTMLSVVLMLNSYSVTLPSPSRPAFFVGVSEANEMDTRTRNLSPTSRNEVSITELDPR